MAVEYNLVVIGGSTAGIQAAIAAASLKARVALVDQGIPAFPPELITRLVLAELGRSLDSARRTAQLGLLTVQVSDRWDHLLNWTEAVSASLQAAHDPAVLASLGIDLIAGKGEFYRKPALGFVVNGRRLRSRAYLLAMGDRLVSRPIPGLEAKDCWTIETALAQLAALQPPQRLVVIGGDRSSIELAQGLAHLGVQVTIANPHVQLLPQADSEAVQLIQAQLETDGIRILSHAQVTQVQQIQAQTWVQVGNQAIETDKVLLAVDRQPHVESLNLAAANVRWSATGIEHNAKFQTTNPRVYFCSDDSAAAVQLAVNNALFPLKKPANFPPQQILHTMPELVQLGATEAIARQQFGDDVVILRQSYNTSTKTQIQDETTGFCKLVVRRNGKLVGAHLVGAEAATLSSPIALAIQQNLRVSAIAMLPCSPATLPEIVRQAAAEWQQAEFGRSHCQDWLASWFSWRRSAL
jgi:pyruvate/2-oxoglutarate dehydrogenase complex dihydrolipoamide dehydrogenase (E3) component